jgi:hypothetical protein
MGRAAHKKADARRAAGFAPSGRETLGQPAKGLPTWVRVAGVLLLASVIAVGYFRPTWEHHGSVASTSPTKADASGQGWRKLTDAETEAASAALARIPKRRVKISVPNPEADRTALAAQLAAVFSKAGWDQPTIETPTPSFQPGTKDYPKGIYFRVRATVPDEAYSRIASAVGGLFDPEDIKASKADAGVEADVVQIDIWPKEQAPRG